MIRNSAVVCMFLARISIVLAVTSLTTGFAFQVTGVDDDPNAAIDERFGKAQQHNLRGEFDQAFAIYDQILSERGIDVPVLVTYGNMKWKAGDLREAEARLRRAVEAMPTHIKARQFLGQLLFHQGRRKEAREVFEYMLTMDFMRGNVRHSAILNLAKMDLIEENWRQARRHFRLLRGEGGKADRKSGERGLSRLKEMMGTDDWGRVDSRFLHVHFSPETTGLAGTGERKKFATELDDWIVATIKKLGMQEPEPWHLYVFHDNQDSRVQVGREQAHGWDFSWWLSYTALNEAPSARHTLAVQLVARIGASRANSRSLVEGFCAYLAGDVSDPHAAARSLLKKGRLPSIMDLHHQQRRLAQYECGSSYVRYMLDTYGWEKFLKLYQSFNLVVNGKQFKIGVSKSIDWQRAFDRLYSESLGVDFGTFESGWKAFLQGSGG